jgi:hypothetical protein
MPFATTGGAHGALPKAASRPPGRLKVLFQGKPLSGADVERGDTVTVVPETRDAVEDHVARSTAVNNFGRGCRTKGVTKPILHIGAVLDV